MSFSVKIYFQIILMETKELDLKYEMKWFVEHT